MTDTEHVLTLTAAYLCDSNLAAVSRRKQLDTLLQVSDGTDPDLCLERLAAAEAVARTMKATQTMAVLDARAHDVTWEQIGTALGVTKQAAQQRFRSLA